MPLSTNLPQYPAPPGNMNQVVSIITGPASYTQVSPASPPTGGVAVTAAQLGLQSIHFAQATCSDDGTYVADVILPNNPLTDTVTGIILIITVAATGAQVSGATNLSGRTFRINAWGS